MGKNVPRKGWQASGTAGGLIGAGPAWYDLVAMTDRDRDMPSDDAECGLYVHIPFCRTKCGYCDFYSVAVENRDTAALLDRVGREIGQRVAKCPYKIRTVFWGGGTPTILPDGQFAALLKSQARVLPPLEIEEFTVEANPATIDDERARLLVEYGVTRVSMGAQSFSAGELARLERLHSPQDIGPSVGVLRRHGVLQVNLDLMFGIPGQTLESWTESLERAIDLDPDHLACYGLTYEPGTSLTAQTERGQVKPCDESLESDMYLHAVDALAAAGFAQYEISNFAKADRQCQHNLMYWRNRPYIGVGPSAAGCLDNRRYKNIADVAGYVRLMDQQGHAETENETLDVGMIMTELIMLQLRLVEGLSIACFRQRTGADPLTLLEDVLARLTDLGFVTVSDTHIALTRRGRLISDAVMTELACACPEVRTPPPSTLLPDFRCQSGNPIGKSEDRSGHV